MSSTATDEPRGVDRRVALATLVGTSFEWYDFFIYSTAAALVFPALFFDQYGAELSVLLSFATVGISFLFRPLGAFLAGALGDRAGRKVVLVVTLLVMGVATTAVGLLPTAASIGIAAPILLLTLRIFQGLAAGGEWGGATLMAVEHAHPRYRARAGIYPQLGVPVGLLMASGVNALMTGVITPGDAFVEWGWRVPFLLSIVLVVLGYLVRRAVDESPVFAEMKSTMTRAKAPVAALWRRHGLLVFLAALVFAGNNAAGYMTTGPFVAQYATNPEGPVGLSRTAVLLAIAVSAVTWGLFTIVSGSLGDRIGRRKTLAIGNVAIAVLAFPMFALVGSGSALLLTAGLVLFTVGLGLAYGPLCAFYAELFPASVRTSGVSIAYAFGAILGGAFSPTIAQYLLQRTGSLTSAAVYLAIMALLALGALAVLRDRPGIDLSITNEEAQQGAIGLGRRAEKEPVS